MSIYLGMFVLSCMFIYASERSHTKQSKRLYIAIALLLPAILAGLRADIIGTDVKMYAIPFYNEAIRSSNFSQYFANHITSLLSEPMYYIVTYILSRFFKDYHWGLLVYQIIPVIFVYMGFNKLKQRYDVSICFCMLLYYFMLYNNSLNIMRQSIAVGIAFYAFTCLESKEYKKYIIFTILAVSFHTSAILSLTYIPMYWILQQERTVNDKKKVIQCCVFIAALIAALVMGSKLIKMLVGVGFIRDYYLEYLSGGKFYTGGGVSAFTLIFEIICIVLQLLTFRYTDKKRLNTLLFMMSSVIIFIANFSLLWIQYIERFGYYFIPLQLVGLSNVSKSFSKKSRITYYVFVTGMLFVYWYYFIVIHGAHQTIPYQFFF